MTKMRLRLAAFPGMRASLVRRRICGILPDAFEWRRVCAPTNCAPSDDRAVYGSQELSNRTRTLGWVVPSEGGFSGHFFGPHPTDTLDYGTSIYIDPDRQLFVVLLTNRVNPTRENMKIAKVRPALHDAVMQALGLASSAAPAN